MKIRNPFSTKDSNDTEPAPMGKDPRWEAIYAQWIEGVELLEEAQNTALASINPLVWYWVLRTGTEGLREVLLRQYPPAYLDALDLTALLGVERLKEAVP